MQEIESQDLSPAKRALYELRHLRARLDVYERAAHEPIAITGLALRLPGGANDAASFWRLLDSGGDGVGPVPADRWEIERYYDAEPATPGKMYTREGGFLNSIDQFDAPFFAVSPREAALMDPQQRLLLEVAWEALENAGLNPLGLAGSATGVFLGLSNSDHARLAFGDPSITDVYLSTGSNYSVAAGRISFFLGLNGPSLVVDTACSSSLVGLHLACQSLRSGECRLALAGGVNLILSPEVTVNFCKAGMLAADSRCKTFDASADGYIRGEGCGVIVLKRLSDALAEGDNILALVRGTAVNQDGRSSGLTVPNGPAQEEVIRQALANARVEPADIDYIEAHGTGTSLGDPIEAHALAAVLGTGRDASRPLVVGSVKTNIGHLESAAGVAGLIKVVLALRHGRIPAHLHFQNMNPHIDWKGVPVEIPVNGKDWKGGSRPRLAGVSSFGFSGTNAHAILEEAPARGERQPGARQRDAYVLALSARSEAALATLAERYAADLAESEADLGDICYTAKTGRAHLPERAVYIAATRQELRTRLLEGTPLRGRADGAPEVAFLFTGQGAQYAGMGRELYETEPVFRAAIEACAAAARDELKPGLVELLYGSATELLNDTRYTQPAGFALQYALAQLWKSWGVEPAVVLGHSVGEYAAACVAGTYSLEDGMRFITARGRLTGGLPQGQGAMAAILAPEKRVLDAVARFEPWVSIAAYNGPESVVIAGRLQEVEILSQEFAGQGAQVERLRVSHGFHSPLMDEVAAEFGRQIAPRVSFSEPRVMLISTVTGGAVGLEDAGTGEYWRRQVRDAVRFHQAIQTLAAQGCSAFVEIGPGSTLLGMGKQTIGREGQLWTPSIRRSRRDNEQMAESLAELYLRGVPVDWNAYEAGRGRRRVALPAYPFERQRYWLDARASRGVEPEICWNAIRESAQRQSGQGRLDLDVASYARRWEYMDRLTGAFIRSTLSGLQAFPSAGERRTIESLQSAYGIGNGYRKLLSRWLGRLVAEGALEQQEDEYVAVAGLGVPDIGALEAEARSFFGSDHILLDYLISCGSQLSEIITGRLSPLETLFPGGEFTRAEDIYERAPLSNYFAEIARAALEAVVRVLPGSALRVVEIGAGTGATTAALLPALSGRDAEYHFTDVSDVFLRHAAQKFAAWPFVHYGLLNIEKPPAESGYQPGSFDVVVATNVLHATTNLDQTLGAVRSLLAPGGHLIVCEVTSYLPWFDITTGLIEGWQSFEDDRRSDHPLLSAPQWEKALADAGFERTFASPADGSPGAVLGQHVIVARTPGTQAERHFAVTASARAAAVSAQSEDSPWVARLADAAAESEKREILLELVRAEIANVLRLNSPESLESRRRLIDLGLDSLMAVELRNRLAKMLRLASALPATLVFDHPTIEALAAYLYSSVLDGTQAREEAAASARNGHGQPGAISEQVQSMSEEDAEALLLEKLKTL